MHKKLLTWVFLIALAGLPTVDALAQGSEAGQIILARVTGQVTLTNKADGSTRPAVNDERITAGIIVSTAAESSLVLIFSNGSTINLRGDSVLDIEQFLQDPFSKDFRMAEATTEPSVSTTRLKLSRGELIGNVKTLNTNAGSSFTVDTPVGAAGIRGTTFRIVFRPDGTGRAFFSITTVEGNVVLSQGAVDIPVAAINDQAQEIAIEIDVQTDANTGEITVAAGGQTFTVQTAGAASTAEVLQATQQIVEAVVNVAFQSPGITTPPDAPASNQQSQSDPEPEAPPPPQAPPIRTTPGDGKAG